MAGLDADDFLNCTNFALRKATRAATQFYDEALAPTGLRITQFPVLALAAGRGPITVARLAEDLVMDRTTLSRNLKPLVRAGWLQVTPGEDQRERLVAATDAGRAVLAQAQPLWRKAQVHMRDALGRQRWAELIGHLTSITRAAGA